MKLAIVGTSINFSDNEDRDIRQTIALILKDYVPLETTIISGGAKGVDSIAHEIALLLGFAVKPILPLGIGWKFNKVRNIEIAEDCDKLICISVPVHTEKCYHHKKGENETDEAYQKRTDHEKTAGCWTLNKVKEMYKPYQLIVIPKRVSH